MKPAVGKTKVDYNKRQTHTDREKTMSEKLANLNAQQLKTLLSTLVGMGVSDIDADQTYATLVDDNDAEEQDVEIEFVYKGRPTTILVKAAVTHNAAPVFTVVSEEPEISNALVAAL